MAVHSVQYVISYFKIEERNLVILQNRLSYIQQQQLLNVTPVLMMKVLWKTHL